MKSISENFAYTLTYDFEIFQLAYNFNLIISYIQALLFNLGKI